jgi:hypothetical protein
MDKEPKRPVGRPSKYSKVLQAQADEYLSRLGELGHVVPSRAGLCCYLGIAKSTSYEWEEIYRDFSDALRAVEVMQEHMTLNGALANKLNPTIAKLVLSNNHGYSESSKIDHTSSGKIITFAAMYGKPAPSNE